MNKNCLRPLLEQFMDKMTIGSCSGMYTLQYCNVSTYNSVSADGLPGVQNVYCKYLRKNV
jgi:hypothetical protein